MSNPKFSQLSVLVVDDFANFRSTMTGMLNKLGIKKVEEATSAAEAIHACIENQFDLILCDYNLGEGRNGQNVLEELRHRHLIKRYNLFVMVTAEASQDMVLSTYDCEPDDYLMKPLNLMVLEQRLERLVQLRDALRSVYVLMEKEQFDSVISELETIVQGLGRHTLVAQKLLGQLYLDRQRLDEAEKLYRTNVEKRNLDWAQLGVAKVAMARGNVEEAVGNLEALVKNNPLFLPARDALIEIYEKQRNFDKMLVSMQDVVALTSQSLLRQRKLASVAMDHGDIKKAADASFMAMKLGEGSCHKSTSDSLAFLSAAGNALESGLDYGRMDLLEESKKCFTKLSEDIALDGAEQLQAGLMAARVHALSGEKSAAKKIAQECLEQMTDSERNNLDVGLAQYSYLLSVDDVLAANTLADKIVAAHGDNPELSYKLDRLLPDPKNEVNRQRVAQLNKSGIECHKAGKYEEALALFRRATFLFPRHVGLHLNCLQTMIAQLKLEPTNYALKRTVREQVDKLGFFVTDESHPQYARFQQLVKSLEVIPKK